MDTDRPTAGAARVGRIDPITLEMLWSRVRAIANEAGVTLVRTSFSSCIRDLGDYACAIFDGRARMIMQADANTPGLCGCMGKMLRHILTHHPKETLREGDVLVCNDPWQATGHHNDITIYTPVFLDGEIIAYAASSAHHTDIGGRRTDTRSRDNYEEGLRIPPLKLVRAGEENADVIAFIRHNVRMAESVIGDVRAQVASNHVAGERLKAMCREQNGLNFEWLADEILERSDAATRARIRTIPNGTYTHEAPIAVVDGETIVAAITVTVSDEDIAIDYAGSTKQLGIALNCTLSFTTSYTAFALCTILNLGFTVNEGVLRHLDVTAPSGSIFNAEFPAPVFARSSIGTFLPEMVYTALSAAIPDRVMAPSGAAPLWLQYFFGKTADGKNFAALNSTSGGAGARPDRDGVSCLCFPVNLSNNSLEAIEGELPVVVEARRLWVDSAGPGKHRGGLGQQFIFRILHGDVGPMGGVTFGARGGRYSFPVPGILGGGEAPLGNLLVNGAPAQNWERMALAPGDVVECRIPGGGGFGDPLERDPAAVASDLANGLITPEHAAARYGWSQPA
ncbi:MAG: hydantoinase B/oxoprolinase family protein [Alphaproteobacteria bacterium]